MSVDYKDEVDLFADYQDKEMFDEEDEELGIDYTSLHNEDTPNPAPPSQSGSHIHISGKAIEIVATKPLPESFKKQGVKRALLFLSNSQAIILK